MHLSIKMRLLETKALKLRATMEFISILVSVINIEIIETKTSFLEVLGKSLNNSSFYYSYNT